MPDTPHPHDRNHIFSTKNFKGLRHDVKADPWGPEDDWFLRAGIIYVLRAGGSAGYLPPMLVGGSDRFNKLLEGGYPAYPPFPFLGTVQYCIPVGHPTLAVLRRQSVFHGPLICE